MRKISILMLFLLTLSQAQDNRTDKTGGFLNGRYWNQSSLPGKVMYIQGLRDGQVVAGAAVMGKVSQDTLKAMMDQEPDGIVLGDFVTAIDELYSDIANIRVPMMYAYKYAIYRLRGDSKEQLEIAIRDFRDWSSKQK